MNHSKTWKTIIVPSIPSHRQIIRSFSNLRCLTTGLSGPWRFTLALLLLSLQGALELDAAAVSTVVKNRKGLEFRRWDGFLMMFEWMCHQSWYMFFFGCFGFFHGRVEGVVGLEDFCWDFIGISLDFLGFPLGNLATLWLGIWDFSWDFMGYSWGSSVWWE